MGRACSGEKYHGAALMLTACVVHITSDTPLTRAACPPVLIRVADAEVVIFHLGLLPPPSPGINPFATQAHKRHKLIKLLLFSR